MKAILFFFLGVLISSIILSNLNSQVASSREQGTGYRLQETDGRKDSLSSEDQIDQQAEITTNGDNSSESLNCDLMMEPAAIEEAEQAFKKGLGISRGNVSPLQTTSVTSEVQAVGGKLNAVDPNTNVFTIVKNQTATSAPASTSEQQMDQVVGKKIQGAINKVISHSSAQLQDHYKKADEAWGACDRGWKDQSRIYHELQESRKQLTLSKQKLEEATKATTDEELEKTRLAKISKYALMAGGVIGKAPEPHSQVVGVGVSALGAFAGAINMAWAHGNLILAKREYQQISEQHEQIQGQKDQSHQQLLLLKQHAEEVETLSSVQAEQSNRKCAEQLHPQTDWKEVQWQAWGTLVGPTWSEKESLHLIELVRLNSNWVEEVTKKSWEQKIETGKEQYIALQKKANLASLKRSYESALQQHQRAQTQEEQQRSFLNQGQSSIEELKREIEKRVDEMERLETRDKVQFERKKKEFIEKLKELEKTQLRNQELQKKWEVAVQRTSTQEEQRWTASETYQNAKEEAERTLARVKKAYQTDRELLQRVWLKSATSNYKDWSLPEISLSQTPENTLGTVEETRRSEECEPPLQRLEELERQGRNLRIRGAMMSIATTEKPTALTAILHPFSKQSSLSKQASFYYSAQSNLDQVKEWAQKRQEQPSSQDQERWEIRERLDQLQTEISSIRKELQKEDPFIEGKRRSNSDELDEEDDDMNSNISNATKQTAATTSLSISQSSALSFGGKTQFNSSNKKQPLSSLPSINEEGQDFQEKLTQLEQEARELKKEYFELLDHAENERLSPTKGQKEGISFSEEADRNYAWEEADRKSVAIIQEKRREQEREKIAQEQQESWQTNTERWRLRAQADEALKVFRRAQQRTLKLGEEADKAKTKAQLTAIDKKKDEASAEEKRLKQAWFAAEEEWEKMAQEYRGERSEQTERTNEEAKEKANERLKERDRAVNRRWEKLLKNYQNLELEKSAVDQEEISEAIINLENQLEQAYQDSFITYSDQKALALVHYREVAFQRALDNARNYPQEMVEIWEKIATRRGNTTAQLEKLEINKQAATVFKEEAKRLEKIEKIWKGILKGEQEEKKQAREQAVQEYHQGYYSNWNSLSEQERTLYNNEVKKANEEYDQKRDEIKERIAQDHAEKLRIEAEIKRIEGKSWYSITAAKRKEKLARFHQQLIDLGNTIKKNSDQLNEQEDFLKIGKKAKQTESYYHTFIQAQNSEEKAREQKNNIYWEQAAHCYRKASTHWKEAADDKTSQHDQEQSEEIAALYGQAAESYEKAAQENAALVKNSNNKSKETLIKLYQEEGKLYEQLVDQHEKGGSIFGVNDIQETLQQLGKKIERYLGTRGAQIEELQENLPLLQKRLEELTQEILNLRQQGKEVLTLKKEALLVNVRELLPSCQKTLDDLLQENPESSERAAVVISAIQSQKTKDQELQQAVEKILQLEAKIVPLTQRVTLLASETAAAPSRGDLFLTKGQQQLTTQLNQALEQARKVYNQLLTQPEVITDQFQTHINTLQQLEKQDHHLQQITPQLRQLDQKKTALNARGAELKNSIKAAQAQGDALLSQGQERLYNEAKKLFLEIESIAGQLLTKTEENSERVNDYLRRCSQFQEQDQALQKNAPFLRELGQKKENFQKRSEVLNVEIIAAQNRGETLLSEGKQHLQKTIGQALLAIDQTSNQIFVGVNNPTEQANILLEKLKQLEARDQSLQKNTPILLDLEKKRNLLQTCVKNLSERTITSQNKTYLHQAQQILASKMSQLLAKIDENVKQLQMGANEIPSAAINSFLTQLEELVQQDQQLQQNIPVLEKLDEEKNFFQNRLQTLHQEIQPFQQQQQHPFVEKKKAFIQEIQQALANIDQSAKQFFSGEIGKEGPTQQLLNQLNLLKQRDQILQQRFSQLRDLIQKEFALKPRAEALENAIISSQTRGEITLAQEQQTLLGEMNQMFQHVLQVTHQFLAEDQGSSEETGKVSEAALQPIQEIIPLLEQLRLRDEQLQGSVAQNRKSVRKTASTASPIKTTQSLERENDQAKIIKWRASSEELQKQAAIAQSCEKEPEGTAWYCASLGLLHAAEQAEKAVIAEGSRKSAVAIAWREVMNHSLEGSAFYEKAATAYAAGSEKEAHSWNNAGTGLLNAAAQTEKAIEAEGIGDSSVAVAWGEVASQSVQSSESFSKAARAFSVGKTEEAVEWGYVGSALYHAADKLGQAIEAEESGKSAIAAAWREAASQAIQSGESFTKAAMAKTSGKISEGNKWDDIGKKNQLASDYFTKEAIAKTSGKISESSSWKNAGMGLMHTAEKLGQTIEAEESGKPLAVQALREAVDLYQQSAEKYQQAAIQHQQASEKSAQAVEMRSNKSKIKEAAQLESEGNAMKTAANSLDTEGLSLRKKADALLKK